MRHWAAFLRPGSLGYKGDSQSCTWRDPSYLGTEPMSLLSPALQADYHCATREAIDI